MKKKKRKIDPNKLEEEFYEKDTKTSRQDRKLASSKDRSMYKKTDFEKFQEELEQEVLSKLDRDKLKRGRVTSIRSEGIDVHTDEGPWLCQVRGLLKKTRTQAKNLVAVGDFVLFEPLEEKEGFISYVEPRKSILTRAETISQKKMQILAANIDQVLITASVHYPPLKPTLVDRYIISAVKGNMTPIILVNKIDLLEGEEKKQYEEFLTAHKKTGIQVISLSAKTEENISSLRKVMKEKASVFSGQSGVGKSTLINTITGLNLKVGDVIESTRKGAHTTTRATLIPLEFGGWVIDTPGIKSFGVWDLEKKEIKEYFPEFSPYASHCKFSSCSHLHEPGCAVAKAVETGDISSLRYDSYKTLVKESDKKHRRR